MTRNSARLGLVAALLAVTASPGCGEWGDSGPEAKHNEWQKSGPFSVIVRGVATRHLTGSNAFGAGHSKEPVCVITIGIRVDEPNKEVQYVTPEGARLRDEEGRSFRTVTFQHGVRLNERPPANKVMRTGEAVSDILLFEKDAAKARTLRLRFAVEWKEKEGGKWRRKSGPAARFRIER